MTKLDHLATSSIVNNPSSPTTTGSAPAITAAENQATDALKCGVSKDESAHLSLDHPPRLDAAKVAKRVAQYELSSAVASILETIPKKQLSVDALDNVFERLLMRRCWAETSPIPDPLLTDPTRTPGHSPLKRETRVRIVDMLDCVIDASGLNTKDADSAVFAPLQALAKYRDIRAWRVILKSRWGV